MAGCGAGAQPERPPMLLKILKWVGLYKLFKKLTGKDDQPEQGK